MSMRITDDCINCGACLDQCPNHAIYGPGLNWDSSHDCYPSELKENQDSKEVFQPLSDDYYYIVPKKCTECYLIAKEPQCLTICPIDSIENYKVETKELLKQKILLLHGNNPEYYLKFNKNKIITTDNYSISEEFDDDNTSEEKSMDNSLIKFFKMFKFN